MVVRLPNASCRPPYSVTPSTWPTKPPVKSFTLLIFVTFSTTQSSTVTSPLILPANAPVAKTLGSPSPLGFNKSPNTSPRFPNKPPKIGFKRSNRPWINPVLSLISLVEFVTETFWSFMFFTATCWSTVPKFLVDFDIILPKNPTPDCSLVSIGAVWLTVTLEITGRVVLLSIPLSFHKLFPSLETAPNIVPLNISGFQSTLLKSISLKII